MRSGLCNWEASLSTSDATSLLMPLGTTLWDGIFWQILHFCPTFWTYGRMTLIAGLGGSASLQLHNRPFCCDRKSWFQWATGSSFLKHWICWFKKVLVKCVTTLYFMTPSHHEHSVMMFISGTDVLEIIISDTRKMCNADSTLCMRRRAVHILNQSVFARNWSMFLHTTFSKTKNPPCYNLF